MLVPDLFRVPRDVQAGENPLEAFRLQLLLQPVERALHAAGGAAVRPPIREPDRARIVLQQHVHHQLHAIVHVVVASDGALVEEIMRRIIPLVLDQVRVAFAIGCEDFAHQLESALCALVGRLGAVGDNSFHVPLVAVEEEADEGAFVVGIAARVCFHEHAELFRSRSRISSRCGPEESSNNNSRCQREAFHRWRS